MKNKELFDKSVAILVNSYHRGTLEHRNGCGCGVGNLIAGHLGINIEFEAFSPEPVIIWRDPKGRFGFNIPHWLSVHSYGHMKERERGDLNGYNLGLKQIAGTGYTPQETCALEGAFESCYPYDKDGYHGLMNMVDTLTKIHETPSYEGDKGKYQLTAIKNKRSEEPDRYKGMLYHARPSDPNWNSNSDYFHREMSIPIVPKLIQEEQRRIRVHPIFQQELEVYANYTRPFREVLTQERASEDFNWLFND